MTPRLVKFAVDDVTGCSVVVEELRSRVCMTSFHPLRIMTSKDQFFRVPFASEVELKNAFLSSRWRFRISLLKKMIRIDRGPAYLSATVRKKYSSASAGIELESLDW